jgi:ubiquinone/menaquinone biosynthesis C-methylase UbiE
MHVSKSPASFSRSAPERTMSFVTLAAASLLLPTPSPSAARSIIVSPSASSTVVSLFSRMATSGGSPAANNNNAKFVYGKDDVLFGHIEERQGDKPWGRVLDAGTGAHSLRWLATLPINGLVAVTADSNMQRNCQREIADLGIDNVTELVQGNWFDETNPLTFAEDEFDVILCDYLIGAMDGFSPYRQDLMIPNLTKYLKPAGHMYIVGLEPIPDDSDSVISRVRQVRDACILLAGHKCYREYPATWIERQIRHIPDLEYRHRQHFTILYHKSTIVKQINVGRSKLPLLPDYMRDSMRTLLNDLERRADDETEQDTKRIPLGFDYVVTAEKRSL